MPCLKNVYLPWDARVRSSIFHADMRYVRWISIPSYCDANTK